MDYDDGVLIGRNVGKRKHSRSQILIAAYICDREEKWGITGYVEGDDFAEVEGKARLYLARGVDYVWSVDPTTARCWRHHSDGSMSIVEGSVLRVEGTVIEIPVAELLRQI